MDKKDLQRRLSALIDKQTEVSSKTVDTPCWIYQGWQDDSGYGRFSLPRLGQTTTGKDRRRHLYVHRLVYTMAYGPIDKGLDVDHLCFNRLCCRPSHLEAVTHEENIRRRDARER